MSIIVDVLSTNANPQTVTVNTAALDVPVSAPGAFPVGLLSNGGGESKFQPKDNFRILSCGIVLPYQFGCSTNLPNVNFSWRDSTAAVGFLFVGSTIGSLYLPMEDFETALDVYQLYPVGAAGTYIQLVLTVNSITRVSMINAPASLNGLSLPVIGFAKIEHNLPLVI